MGSLNFDEEKIRFRDYYNENRPLFVDAVDSYRTLISLLLADNDNFSLPIVNGRVKEREECITKFSVKYQKGCEENKQPYEIKDFITDVIGLRVICFYESDIALVRDLLSNNFKVVSETDKTQVLESHDDTFGYKGLHLDLKLSDVRVGLPEYRRVAKFQFEVQIRTIVQDAWSVLDHKIKYKKSIPPKLKRRINRMAALFELADQEFENIRNETIELEKSQTQSSNVVESPAMPHTSPPQPLTSFAFAPIASKHFPTYKFEAYKVDGFVEELLEVDSTLNPASLEEILERNTDEISKYADYQQKTYLNRLNPYTTIRHSLYLADKQKYSKLLFDLQRNNFEKWLSSH